MRIPASNVHWPHCPFFFEALFLLTSSATKAEALSLHVSIQAQIINLLARLSRRQTHLGSNRRHVFGQNCRIGSGSPRVRSSAASLHKISCKRRSDSRSATREATTAHRAQRGTAVADRSSCGLSLSPALSVSRRGLRARCSASGIL